jgi:hypothetical protein
MHLPVVNQFNKYKYTDLHDQLPVSFGTHASAHGYCARGLLCILSSPYEQGSLVYDISFNRA